MLLAEQVSSDVFDKPESKDAMPEEDSST